MIQYIQNVTCPIEECKIPQIRFKKTPSNQPTDNPTICTPTTYNPTHQTSSEINTCSG